MPEAMWAFSQRWKSNILWQNSFLLFAIEFKKMQKRVRFRDAFLHFVGASYDFNGVSFIV